MDTNEYIHLVFVKLKTNERQVALSMNESPQNINRKLSGDMKLSFIESIADALNCDIDLKFVDRNSGKPVL